MDGSIGGLETYVSAQDRGNEVPKQSRIDQSFQGIDMQSAEGLSRAYDVLYGLVYRGESNGMTQSELQDAVQKANEAIGQLYTLGRDQKNDTLAGWADGLREHIQPALLQLRDQAPIDHAEAEKSGEHLSEKKREEVNPELANRLDHARDMTKMIIDEIESGSSPYFVRKFLEGNDGQPSLEDQWKALEAAGSTLEHQTFGSLIERVHVALESKASSDRRQAQARQTLESQPAQQRMRQDVQDRRSPGRQPRPEKKSGGGLFKRLFRR